jgi:hypothetical protein
MVSTPAPCAVAPVHTPIFRCGFPLVLVSPCDSYRLHQIFLGNETVQDQIDRLRRMAPRDKFELLPLGEYGVSNKAERYFIPVTRDALLSIMEGPPFSQFRQDKPGSFWVENSCLVCIGGCDDLQTASAAEMFTYMSGHFDACTHFLAPDGDHEFAGGEVQLASAIVGWVTGSGV